MNDTVRFGKSLRKKTRGIRRPRRLIQAIILISIFIISIFPFETGLADNPNQGHEVIPQDTGEYGTFLPFLGRSVLFTSSIKGSVTYNGAQAAGITLELMRVDGSWSRVYQTTVTDSTGAFLFTGIEPLTDGASYYVLFRNVDNNEQYLSFWYTEDVTELNANEQATVTPFDIQNINLLSPTPGLYSVPVTFTWNRRNSSLPDSYDFNIISWPDLNGYIFYTDPPLGYVGSFTLSSLPSEVLVDTDYGWAIGAHSPQGGYGESLYVHQIRFTSTGSVNVSAVPNPNGKDGLLNRPKLKADK